MITDKVLYEELLPSEFRERIGKTPIAYLPLGTLEWHGEHMPLGSDGIQSQALFKAIAKELGGIVLPMLYLGPDSHIIDNNKDLYGMDIHKFEGRNYDHQQLDGSAYWILDDVFKTIIDATAKQLARAGFKILVAHGHGPSTSQFIKLAAYLKEKYNIICYNCFFDDLVEDRAIKGYQVDHAGSNETSIVMAVRPELVNLSMIKEDIDHQPLGVAGIDPRKKASSENGNIALEYTKNRMIKLLEDTLDSIK